jgi:ligand-binding sensor domain-containing protein
VIKKVLTTKTQRTQRILCALCVFVVLSLLFALKTGAHFQTGQLLQGNVFNENDQPQAGATVSLWLDGVFVQSFLTLSDGQFTVVLPRPGQYTITISQDGFRPHTEILTINKDEILNRQFKLVPSSLHVVVLDATQEKLSDAIVTVKGEDGVLKRAIESPKGDYYFGRLKPGVYQLTASVPGFETRIDEGVYIPSDNKTMLLTQLLQRASPIPIGDKLKARYNVPLLPSNRVQALLQDRVGAIWLGTARGAVRFNGSEINSLDSQESMGLTGAEIRVIYQDSRGYIWFATAAGLVVKRPDARSVESIPLLVGRTVRAITEDRRGGMWFATDKGAARYTDNRLVEYTTAMGMPSDDVRHILPESHGDGVWAATGAGVVKIIDTKIQPLLENESAVDWPTNFILEDSRRVIWFLTETGLRRLDGKQITVPRKESLTRPLTAAIEDRVGNIWFSDTQNGVYIYDLGRDEVSELLTSDRILSLMADREGNVWFGTENGAVRQDFYSFVTFNTSRGLPEADVYSLLVDKTRPEALWVGTATGLIYFDGLRFSRVYAIPTGVAVRHSLQQRNGTIWFATSDGLYRFQTGQWDRFDAEHGLASSDIRYMCEDLRDGNLWLATKKGVVRFNTETHSTSSPAASPEQLQMKADVRHIYQQRNGTLWFSTDKGVYRYDPNTYDLTIIGQGSGLESVDIRWIEEDESSGLLLLATAQGVELLNGQKALPERRSSSLTGESIQCIFRDRDGMIWFGTDDGKVQKYLNTRIPAIGDAGVLITTYTREHSDLAGSVIRAIAQDSSGAIWFATESGLSRHLPNRIIPTVDCRMEVNGVEVATRDIEAGLHNIKFRFIALSTLGEVGFVYRIIVNGQPWEYHWVGPQANRREAVFNGLPQENAALPDGEHIFEVIAVNRDLYGFTNPPFQLRLRIDRPFWKKLWFYLFIGFTMTGATITTVVVRQRQRREYFLPEHLRTFVPIDPNPYIVGNPIRTPSMFFGREDDFNYARIKLEGAAQGGVVLVFCGERRAGKSSILYQILHGRLGDRFVPVFIDLQEMVVSNDHEFFGRTARLIAEAVGQSEVVAMAGVQPAIDHSAAVIDLNLYPFSDHSRNAFHLFLDFLNSVLARIGDRRLLILMDEYELLENKVEEGKLSKEIFTFMASLIDNHDRLSFVFTGSRKLEERDRRYWREMLRRSMFRKVSFLSERDTRRLITDPVKDRLVYGRGVEAAIYRLTAGQPFYTQYICQAIVDHLNEWKRNYVLRADLKQVIDEIIDNPLPQMIYVWEGFSDDEKLVMSLLAEVLDDQDAAATSAQIARAIAREGYPVKLSENTIRLTLEELFRIDVLKKIGDEAFCFRIDLLRRWIKYSHSIWRVVREVRTL